YETFLPTTVAARAQDVLQAVERLPEHPMIPGFHLEGPFLSPAFPGAQPPTAILDPIEAGPEWDEVFDHPKLRLVTLAPERPGAPELIARLASRGVVVSMGHTDATWMEARQGFAQGARHTTHTFNAMRALHHREPGALGFALGEDRLYSELIYDRIHVSRAAAEVLVRCKPADRLLAVSDSSMATGLPDGSEVAMWGHRCVIHDGSVRLADGGSLAGSTITLYDAFRNMAADFGPEAAILACCLNPRRALGLTTEPRLYLEVDSRSFAIVQRHQVQH
ncbi:MAG TPA: amidohydrolase family protein, partial [Fimbriimonadaceae bacterium]|nr:amidohydrolase family protein [Fimbriimonadaceae bacterium]